MSSDRLSLDILPTKEGFLYSPLPTVSHICGSPQRVKPEFDSLNSNKDNLISPDELITLNLRQKFSLSYFAQPREDALIRLLSAVRISDGANSKQDLTHAVALLSNLSDKLIARTVLTMPVLDNPYIHQILETFAQTSPKRLASVLSEGQNIKWERETRWRTMNPRILSGGDINHDTPVTHVFKMLTPSARDKLFNVLKSSDASLENNLKIATGR